MYVLSNAQSISAGYRVSTFRYYLIFYIYMQVEKFMLLQYCTCRAYGGFEVVVVDGYREVGQLYI
jgi:hypothetical protein